MNIRLTYTLILLISLVTVTASAQYIQVDNTYTAQKLVEALVSNSCSQFSNATISGATGFDSSPSYGYFTAGASNFPFKNGIILSTGFATSAKGPNLDVLSEGDEGWPGDNDLERALNERDTYNATILEFDFIPISDNISFDYILASEEYLEFVDPEDFDFCSYSDGFAFLLKPEGSTQPYQNLAVIPNTATPVKVTTVRGPGSCPEANVEYFAGYNPEENNTDFNGQTIILTAKSAVVPNTKYHIKLVIADKGDTLYDSAIFLGGGSFNFSADFGPDRLITTNNPVCAGEDVTLNNTAGAKSYKWFKNDVEIIGAINATYKPTTPGIYRAEAVFVGNCAYTSTIKLEYAPAIPAAMLTYLQCDDDNDGLTAYYLEQVRDKLITSPDLTALNYYISLPDATANTNGISIANNGKPFYNTSRDQIIYFKVQNQYGCQAIIPIQLSVSAINTIALAPLQECQNDSANQGFASFDLSAATAAIAQKFPQGTIINYYENYNDALANQASLPNNYTNTTAGTSTIYVRANSLTDCFSIVPLQLIVSYIDSSDANQNVIICENSTQTLNAGTGFTTYTWNTVPVQSTQQIIIEQPGTYSVTVTNQLGCQYTKTFTVTTSGSAKNVNFEIKDFSKNKNSVIITVLDGLGSYEYSIDGINYQQSNLFENLTPGKHLFFVRDINGCNPVYKKTIYILDYPLAFTPNNDGNNDIWKIPYLNTRPKAYVNVFDRYGMLVSQFSGSSGWDGNFNGRPLPSTDYWFVIQLEDATVKGHFSLIR